LNKDFTVADLKEMAPKLKGDPVLYNHGDTPEIKTVRVGKIRKAWVDSEEHLAVKGRLLKPQKMGPALHDRIRDELVTGQIPMLSMHWTAPALNRSSDPSKLIAAPDKRWMKEISLVPKGFYPEAQIVAVAASDSEHTAWKLVSGLLTSSAVKTSTVVNARSMSANTEEKHAALLKHLEKELSPEEKLRFGTDATYREDVYAALFPKLLTSNQKFEQKEKRERDEYVSRESEETEKMTESLKTHYPDAAIVEALSGHWKSTAKDFEARPTWQAQKQFASWSLGNASKVKEYEKTIAGMKSAGIAAADASTATQEVAVVASDTRNAKKPATPGTPPNPTSQPVQYRDGLLARLQANKNH
jgi:hypothetical protein